MIAYQVLVLLSGGGWTIAYALIILRGRRDRTYGIPAVALFGNIWWEFYWTFFGRLAGSNNTVDDVTTTHVLFVAVSATWLALDLIVLYQFIRYGHKEFKSIPTPAFFAGATAVFVLCGAVVVLYQREIGEDRGLPALPSVTQAFIMAALFFSMALHRNSIRGQSIGIGIAKLIGSGSGCIAVLLGVFVLSYPESHPHILLLIVLSIATILLDTGYLIIIARLKQASPESSPNNHEIDSYSRHTQSTGSSS